MVAERRERGQGGFERWRPSVAPRVKDENREWCTGKRRFAQYNVMLRCTAGLKGLIERRPESRTPGAREV